MSVAPRLAVLVALVALLALGATAVAQAPPKPRVSVLGFGDDYEKALAKAKKDGKLVLLYASTPCHT